MGILSCRGQSTKGDNNGLLIYLNHVTVHTVCICKHLQAAQSCNSKCCIVGNWLCVSLVTLLPLVVAWPLVCLSGISVIWISQEADAFYVHILKAHHFLSHPSAKKVISCLDLGRLVFLFA